MNANESGETGTQLRERLRVHPRTFQAMWKRKLEYPFDANKVCTRTEIEVMELAYKGKVKMKRVDKPTAAKELPSDILQEESAVKTDAIPGKKMAMISLMAAPAIASLQNMLHVTNDITNDGFAAVLFTYTFTAAPFIFVVFRANGGVSYAITGLLIAVEVFCNTVRIYGGLTGFGGTGNPTRFLGEITEICNSGTYHTATVLAVILSLFAAGVMYKAYFEYQKQDYK